MWKVLAGGALGLLAACEADTPCPLNDATLNDLGGCECSNLAGVVRVVNGECCGEAGATCRPPGSNETEPNDAFEDATQVANPGTWFGTIDTAADEDWYRIFNLNDAPELTVTLENLTTDTTLQVRVVYTTNLGADPEIFEAGAFTVGSRATEATTAPSPQTQNMGAVITGPAGARYRLVTSFDPGTSTP